MSTGLNTFTGGYCRLEERCRSLFPIGHLPSARSIYVQLRKILNQINQNENCHTLACSILVGCIYSPDSWDYVRDPDI